MRAIWKKKQVVSGKEKQLLTRFLQLQLVVVLIIAMMIGLTWSVSAGVSALFGGLLVWVPSIVLAIVVFARRSYRDPKKIVSAFYIGETIKITLTALLLIILLQLYAVNLIALLIGMIAVYVTYLFV